MEVWIKLAGVTLACLGLMAIAWKLRNPPAETEEEEHDRRQW